MLTVADLPLLTPEDVLQLIGTWQLRAHPALALLPVVDGIRGHPVLLSSNAVKQVAEQPPELGVRDWLQRHSPLVEEWQTSSAGYIFDIDTPTDIEALNRDFKLMSISWPIK
jgi:CTP:molybdopterin cytidylyltransferase MocA